jgi:uncharacterized membrane protein
MRFIIIFIPIIISAIAQIILKSGIGSTAVAGSLSGFFFKTLTSPGVILGLSLYGLGALLWLIVLSREDVSFAFPLVSFAYVLAIILSAIFLKEHITIGRIIGSALIMAGIFVIARFG